VGLRARLLGLRRGVAVARDVRVEVARGASLVVGEGCSLGPGVRILVRGGTLRLGSAVRLEDGCRLVCQAGIDVGDGAVLGPQSAVMDAEPSTGDVQLPVRVQGVAAAPVTIGAGAVLGPGAVVLAGARVAPGAVLAARTVTRATAERRDSDPIA
jgi:acetyltransferase-like isoleucine patch superfamily enzyme